MLEQIERVSTLLVCSFSVYLDLIIIRFHFSDKSGEYGAERAERDKIRQERHNERQRAAALQRAGAEKR